VSLNELLDQIGASTKPAIDHKNLKISTTGLEENRNIFADPVRLREILLNLISNAIKFTMQGSITISFKEGDRDFEIGISDTGIGISTKDFGRIFKEFEHIEKPEGMNATGTGLGLPLTKRLVELHGGQLSFTSQLGLGTTFTLKLPKKLKEQVVVASTTLSNEDVGGKGPGQYNILLIEDDRKDALMIKTMLDEITSFKHVFYLASTLQKGLEYLDQCDIDVVLLDLILPDSRDLNTAKMVLGRKRNASVIILTRKDDKELAMEIVSTGAQDYLVKTNLTTPMLEKSIKFSAARQQRTAKL
jgi:CheY-like chemotaxis protein